MAQVANGWSMNTDTMGVYGNYYLKRAMIAQVGLGANLPEDAIYPLNLADFEGNPLNGADIYTIHFDKGEAPPAQAFWSITLYDQAGFQVANSIIALRYRAGCRSNTTPTARSTSISRMKVRAPTRKQTGCPHQEGPTI